MVAIAGLEVRIKGTREGLEYMQQLRSAVGQYTGTVLRLEADKPYAYGIEFGRHRSGRLARKAGPAYYMRGAWQRVRPGTGLLIALTLADGPVAVREAQREIGRRLVHEARDIVPVRSGALRESIRAIPGGSRR